MDYYGRRVVYEYGGHYRMIIVCDIDSVLNDLIPKTLALYNSRTGKKIRLSNITTYKFYECLPQEVADGICELFKEKELWDSLEPAHDSQWGLKTLINNGHEVYLATATLPENLPWKVQWIKKYFPFIDTQNIICIQNKGLLKCHIMIDDCLDNLTSNICERIVINHPWNQNKTKEYVYDIHRAYSFKDVVNIIKKIERKDMEWEK
jgi:5'(3')-deoxyribonucleotidase